MYVLVVGVLVAVFVVFTVDMQTTQVEVNGFHV